MLSSLILFAQLWMTFPSQEPVILNGSWQSCRDENGDWGERIYDRHEHGKWVWSLHMGPFNDFALYKPADEPEDGDNGYHYHSGPTNLLGPNYQVTNAYARGKRTWTVPSLHLWVNIVQAGGSREDCQSFVVLIRRQQ